MHIVYLFLANSTLGGCTKFPSVRYKISWAPPAREKSNGIIIAHESKRKQASAVGRPKSSIADTTYRNPENTFPFVSETQA